MLHETGSGRSRWHAGLRSPVGVRLRPLDPALQKIPAGCRFGMPGYIPHAPPEHKPGAAAADVRGIHRAAEAALWIRAIALDLQLSVPSARWERPVLRSVPEIAEGLLKQFAERALLQSQTPQPLP